MKPKSKISQISLGVAVLSLMAGGAVVAQAALTKVPSEVQSGTYALDAAHGKITYYVDHLGFSTYVGQFVEVEAQLVLDSANPARSTLKASIPLTKVDSNSAGLDRHLQTADFFDTANHPVATFTSTRIEVDAMDKNEAKVYGDLTLRGVTRPIVMEVEFNQAGSMRGRYLAGFDGEAKIKRSDFGITYGLPALGDEIKLRIEGEFVKQ